MAGTEGAHTLLEQNLQPDDVDSDSFTDDTSDLTGSLASSIYNFRVENGRTYHAYKDGEYAYPNDEKEQDRLAEDHPKTNVLGTDLSPIQATMVPPNVTFEIDDANEQWVYSHSFDFIHVRQHHCAINEERLFEQAMVFLEPGGWIEMQEAAFPVNCEDSSVLPGSPLHEWSELMLSASRQMGKDLDNSRRYGELMRQAGFINVTSTLVKIPGNDWPRAEPEKTIGSLMLANAMEGLEGFTLAMFTRVHGWSAEEVQSFLEKVKQDISNKSIHAWWPFYIVYGQKSDKFPDEAI